MSFRQKVFTATMGLWLGLVLIKLGNPIILDHLVNSDQGLQGTIPALDLQATSDPKAQGGQPGWMDALVTPWSLAYGIWGFAIIAVLGAMTMTKPIGNRLPLRCLLLLGGWFAWQWIASLDTIDAQLTSLTLKHFTVCVGCFLLGGCVLSRCPNPGLFWLGITMGLFIVFWVGFQQHYGGLDSLRRAVYDTQNLQNLPPEFLKRLNSGRIFSTLVYPNALAGLIILLLAPCLAFGHRLSLAWPNLIRGITLGLLGYAGIACLMWSKSKAGWLIALVMVLTVFWQIQLEKKLKWTVASCLLILGLIAFGYRYYHYFQQGATSVGARFDYWQAALKITAANPTTGTGPGSFFKSYAQVKRPDSEMARLAHNDYLEQACDSGVPGFLLYLAFIFFSMLTLIQSLKRGKTNDWPVVLGLFGWCMHGTVEFGLYIPAIAWPAFTLLGMALAKTQFLNHDNVIVNPLMRA